MDILHEKRHLKEWNMYLNIKTAMSLKFQTTNVHVKLVGLIELQPTIIINVHVKLIFDRSNPFRVMPKFTCT